MSKRIKWTKLGAFLAALSVAFLVVLRLEKPRTDGNAEVYTISTQRETAPVEVRLVNINTADAEELELLPGVGEKLAQRIIEKRQQDGPFASAEELMQIKGIGEKNFEQMKDYITVKEVQP